MPVGEQQDSSVLYGDPRPDSILFNTFDHCFQFRHINIFYFDIVASHGLYCHPGISVIFISLYKCRISFVQHFYYFVAILLLKGGAAMDWFKKIQSSIEYRCELWISIVIRIDTACLNILFYRKPSQYPEIMRRLLLWNIIK